jgi:hypothetical protein
MTPTTAAAVAGIDASISRAVAVAASSVDAVSKTKRKLASSNPAAGGAAKKQRQEKQRQEKQRQENDGTGSDGKPKSTKPAVVLDESGASVLQRIEGKRSKKEYINQRVQMVMGKRVPEVSDEICSAVSVSAVL